MRIIGNILWLLFGGLILAILWLISGIILCVTIIGIPIGIQCFKFSTLMLSPFGKEVIYSNNTSSFLLNILWILFFGIGLALTSLAIGIVWCITIIGIPIGVQCIKFAKLALMPFGAEVK